MFLNILPTEEDLKRWSYKTTLGKSLRSPISRFNLEELIDDINLYRRKLKLLEISYNYRIKSIHSARLKVQRYSSSKDVRSIFNDILGIRIIVDSYDKIAIPEYYRIVDMRDGKQDGYKGMHLYYQIDNEHYPIEIQLNTKKDRMFSDWTHKYLYKKVDNHICKILRDKFDNGDIKSEEDFVKECEKLEVYSSKGF